MNISSISGADQLTTSAKFNTEDQKVSNFQESLNDAMTKQDEKELKDACDQMEQYMISMIFKQMKASTSLGATLFEKGDYEEMFEDQLIDERAKAMVEAGGMGLSKMMYQQLTGAYGQK